jgi:para-nitrobenzyl esterase
MIKTGVSRREFVVSASAAAVGLRGRGVWGQSTAVNLGPAVPGRAMLMTPSGMLKGEVAGGVRVFKGVPFAEPPIGALRFKAPAKKSAWADERDATKFAAAAVQPGEPSVAKSEDCLYLNVWTPEGATGAPVFVWVHGGGFTGGRSFETVTDGSQFAREGVVVVTVAYRLGVLGFLDVEPLLGAEYAGSGNNGLRDVICALEWVRDNIGAFGGDPWRVTLGGESAGAKLTDVLLGVPAADGLFGQAISESGGAERVWDLATAKAVGKGFGKVWGRGAEALKTVAAEELIAAQETFIAGWPKHFPLRPEVDGLLVPRLPVATIAEGPSLAEMTAKRRRRRRLLIGTNRDESAAFVGPHPEHDATAKELGNLSLAAFDAVFAKYKALYPEMSAEMLRIRALTAEEYWVPSVRVAEAFIEGGGEAWMYRLDFAYGSGRMKGLAFHSEDIGLVWDKPNSEEASAPAKQVHSAWVSFLKGYGPAAEGLPEWPGYSYGLKETMVLDGVSRVEQRPMAAELKLWDGVL